MSTGPAVVGTSAITPQLRTKEALYILHNKLNFVKKLTNFSDKFRGGGTGRSYLIGKPAQWTQRKGYAVAPNATIEDKVPLTIGDPIGIDSQYHDDELELDFPNYKQRILEGQMKKLATSIESAVIASIIPQIAFGANSASLAIGDMYRQNRILDEQLADGEKFALLGTQTYEDYLVAMQGNYNPQIDISSQIREGIVGDVAGFKVMKNLLIPAYTTGTRTAVSAGNVVTTTSTAAGGDVTLALTLNAVGDSVFVGEQFTLAGVFDVNPENKSISTILHRFAVLPAAAAAQTGWDVASGTYIADASKHIVVSVQPIYGPAATGTRQNLSINPTAGLVATFVGAANASVAQSLFFDPRHAAVAFVDLPLHTGAVIETWKETDPDTGITLRYERGYNSESGVQTVRWDVQMGQALVQNNFASRYIRTT